MPLRLPIFVIGQQHSLRPHTKVLKPFITSRCWIMAAAGGPEQHRRENRLAKEKSPYLLQHKYNPVDWFPWGEEAFKIAKDQNKPILLSVGYSTCHWCHVMEKESFENENIAKLQNKYFVNIKVDREERPTVDRMYMTFVQALTGHGGWPMTVFLTPDLKPFFGGTYFAPVKRYGMPSFPSLLTHFGEKWIEDSSSLIASSDEIMEDLKKFVHSSSYGESNSSAISHRISEKTYLGLKATYDTAEGGFSRAPKFPTPVTLEFLIRYHLLMRVPDDTLESINDKTASMELSRLADLYGLDISGVESEKVPMVVKQGLEKRNIQSFEALRMIEFTLEKMARGGIHDHVGNGFHRYSVDGHWHVPHFEKMLYDQAQLLSVYSQMYNITKNPLFAEVCRDIIKYVERDLGNKEGAFFSAEDADSSPTFDAKEHKEGAFAVWEYKELEEALGENAKLFAWHYGADEDGNVDPSHDPHGELKNKNVLIQRSTLEETSAKFSKSPEETSQILKNCLQVLWQIRQTKRPKPHLDDKILTSWNGLMISALAKASRCLDQDPSILALATKATDFLHTNMRVANREPGRSGLYRSFRDGSISGIRGVADDHAFLISGLLDLYEASFEIKYLRWAVELQEIMDDAFWDPENKGYFTGEAAEEHVLIRAKDEHDGAEPTSNSMAVMNLVRLQALLGEETGKNWLKRAEETMLAHLESLARHPRSLVYMSAGLAMYLRGFKQYTVSGGDREIESLQKKYIFEPGLLPISSVLRVPPSSESDEHTWLLQQSETLKSQFESQQKGLMLCESGTCTILE